MRTVWLGDCASHRDNNFTALRLVLAWLVLFGHSFSVTASGKDPLTLLLGGRIFIGALAVNGFFAISGFLIAGSWTRNNIAGFVVARVLRIYPALIVCVLITTLALGPAFTTLPLGEYILHPETRRYLRTMTLWPGVHYYLPGVFESQPYSRGVNGSLWSLPAEIRCYVLLLVCGVLGVFKSRTFGNLALAALFVWGTLDFASIPLIGAKPTWMRLASYFALGALAWVNREHVPLNWAIAAVAVFSCFLVVGSGAFQMVFGISVVYLIFVAVYVAPHVPLDRFGDISYGMYIYAWPVQQALVWSGQGGYANAALATPITIILAALSWHFVEEPALLQKRSVEQAIISVLQKFDLARNRRATPPP